MIHVGELKEKIRELAPQFDLQLAVLFGSQARGRTHRDSDIDIAVQGKYGVLDFSKMIEFTTKLYSVLGTDKVKVVDIAHMSPLFRRQVSDDGILLFEKKADLFARFSMLTNHLYIEAKPLFALREQYIKNALGIATA